MILHELPGYLYVYTYIYKCACIYIYIYKHVCIDISIFVDVYVYTFASSTWIFRATSGCLCVDMMEDCHEIAKAIRTFLRS